jgi:hypothetical protein
MKDGVAIGESKARRGSVRGLVDLRAPLMSTPTALDVWFSLCVCVSLW